MVNVYPSLNNLASIQWVNQWRWQGTQFVCPWLMSTWLMDTFSLNNFFPWRIKLPTTQLLIASHNFRTEFTPVLERWWRWFTLQCIQTHFTYTFQNCQCLSTKLISYFNPFHFLFSKLAMFSIHTHFTFQSCPCLASKLISYFNSFHFHFSAPNCSWGTQEGFLCWEIVSNATHKVSQHTHLNIIIIIFVMIRRGSIAAKLLEQIYGASQRVTNISGGKGDHDGCDDDNRDDLSFKEKPLNIIEEYWSSSDNFREVWFKQENDAVLAKRSNMANNKDENITQTGWSLIWTPLENKCQCQNCRVFLVLKIQYIQASNISSSFPTWSILQRNPLLEYFSNICLACRPLSRLVPNWGEGWWFSL